MIREEFETYGSTEIQIDVHFSAGHRILGHNGKCRFLHGHSYTARVTVACKKLDHLGMVIDFSDLKKFVKEWVDLNWDHNMILNSEDPLLLGVKHDVVSVYLKDAFHGRQPYCIGSQINPTAENMAQELYMVVNNEFLPKNYGQTKGRAFYLKSVAIKEEEGSWAAYTR